MIYKEGNNVLFKEIISLQIDNRGRNPQNYMEESIHPVIDNYLIKNNKFPNLSSVKRFLSEEDYNNFLRGYLKKNDVLITLVGNGIGNVTMVPDEKCVIVQNTLGLRCNSKMINEYLYYFLLYKQESIKQFNRGTSQPSIRKTDLFNMEIPLPEISTQNKIASILSSLDDKIENNNAIIANLEEQAKLIFEKKYMNIDLSKENKLENQKFGELFEFVKGRKPKNISDQPKEDYIPYLVKKYIDSNEVTFAPRNDGVLIEDLDVFMLMDGANSGNIYYGYKGIIGSTFSWLKTDRDMVNEYIYWYLLINQDHVRNQNTGSAIPHANKEYINNLEVMLPINIETDKNLKALKNMRLYSINLRRESNRLSETRNTLLPKLMSGDIQVDEVIEMK
ncbi:restriction endonuclease subunit S [Marinilactibacillus psychrotolerans]|uniref:Type I restriction modification DNA specificity domain-containing protein n=1 Tax=Marinilactibacillus psychrotolerans TaxID=191770 RepID=A0AAV3WS35_9LACT|nr:restriction endonuclease subunit S [Marinilactibacillus psychrotolerans]GEL66487.1 hypothetical protein MPS01_06420 [Marinilactibacillus psychrotolerans]GEQ35303.1 hypothetical protein M132T_08110 [Marinilactibacillus psychrotolerans]SDC53048.1 Restriction endonuclease S subunit [Marinilactibacillus psychrotolerans]